LFSHSGADAEPWYASGTPDADIFFFSFFLFS